jgi:ADP-heptose:LPS heptosyltransferase
MRSIKILQKYFVSDDETFLKGLYRELLNREPDEYGLLHYKDFLSKTGTKMEVFSDMVRSYEFGLLISQAKIIQVLQKIMCKNDYDFVKQLYHNIFGTAPKLSQIHIETEKLRSTSKVGLIQNMLLNEEILTQLNPPPTSTPNIPEFSVLNRLHNIFKLDRKDCINELYGELFDSKLEQNEVENIAEPSNLELSKVEIYKAIINSAKFTDQFNNHSLLNCLKLIQRIMNLSDEEFLSEAYREGLDREPDSQGFRYYTQYINNGIKRMEIIKEILCSNEASEKLHSKIENKKKSLKNIESNYFSSTFRNDMETLLKKHNFPFETNIIYKSGGLGDFIQMTPVAKALKMKYPEYPVVTVIGGLFGSYDSVFDEHPYIDLTIDSINYGDIDVVKSLEGLVENVIDIRYISRSYGSLENTKFSYENKWYHDNYPYSGCRLDDLNMHVSDLMLHSLGLEQYADCNDVCVTPDEVPEEIPGEYVVICNSTGGIGDQLRKWTIEEWDELIKWLNSIEIIPVQLGTKSDKLLHSEVMDLRGLTTPRQAAGYLKLSRGYIGVEGGLFHLSKAVGAPAVVIFASTPSVCYAYQDTRVVTKNICRPCLWNGPWHSGQCIRGSHYCLNLPDWKSVSAEVSNMLSERGEG